jgi:hypothetical protein
MPRAYLANWYLTKYVLVPGHLYAPSEVPDPGAVHENVKRLHFLRHGLPHRPYGSWVE